MTTAPVVELTSVSKVYAAGGHIAALNNIDLSVDPSEFVAIIGASGSGKSTLLNMIGTLDRPTSGSIQLLGVDVSQMSDLERSRVRARTIGFVFQSFHLFESMTVLENVIAGLVYRPVAKSDRQGLAKRALASVGLAEFEDRQVSRLSGGQRQRVAIARAVAGDPALILADEPTGNLDSQTSSEILDVLAGLNQLGSTVIMITHDNDVALQANRTLTMLDGEIIQDGSRRQ